MPEQLKGSELIEPGTHEPGVRHFGRISMPIHYGPWRFHNVIEQLLDEGSAALSSLNGSLAGNEVMVIFTTSVAYRCY